MRFYSIVLLPDGSPVSRGWMALPFDVLPATHAQGKFTEDIVADGVPFVLTGTAYGGRVICSIHKDDRLVTQSVILAGSAPERDKDVLGIFLEGLRDAPFIQELTSGESHAFVELTTCLERPLCATLLFPLASRPEGDLLLGWLHRWVGAHLATVIHGES